MSLTSIEKTLTDSEIEVNDNENNNIENNSNNTIRSTQISDVTNSPSLDGNDSHKQTDQMLTTNQMSINYNRNDGQIGDKITKIVTNDKCKAQTYVLKSSKASFIDSGMALKRSASADSIFIPTSYVSSPQLSLHTYCGRLMMDRATQTPEEWEELDKRKIERKINDHFGIIKSVKGKQTQRNSQKGSKGLSNNETNNLLSSTSSSPSSSINVSPQHNVIPKQELSTNTAAVSTTTIPKSGPIAIPNKLALELSSNYRSGNSVEELNQEIESLVLKGISDNNKMGDRIPEGHRAPVIELLWPKRTVKTQTFINGIDYDHDNDSTVGYHNNSDSITSEDSCPSSDISRSESPVSPQERGTKSINDSNHVDYSSSPEINKFLTREPPDGCEKVKIVSEDERANSNHSHKLGPTLRPLKPSSGFILLPSRSSAFLPIPKSNYFNSNTVSALDNLKNEINKYK